MQTLCQAIHEVFVCLRKQIEYLTRIQGEQSDLYYLLLSLTVTTVYIIYIIYGFFLPLNMFDYIYIYYMHLYACCVDNRFVCLTVDAVDARVSD